MTPANEDSLTAIKAIILMQLDSFNGLALGTTRADVEAAAGPAYAEGFGAGIEPLWMTMHEISESVRMTAWYGLAEDAPGGGREGAVDSTYPVLWIERPIVPAQVVDLLALPNPHHPPGADHLMAWPARGLCVRFSRRLQQATLLFAFAPMSESEFDQSPMALRD